MDSEQAHVISETLSAIVASIGQTEMNPSMLLEKMREKLTPYQGLNKSEVTSE